MRIILILIVDTSRYVISVPLFLRHPRARAGGSRDGWKYNRRRSGKNRRYSRAIGRSSKFQARAPESVNRAGFPSTLELQNLIHSIFVVAVLFFPSLNRLESTSLSGRTRLSSGLLDMAPALSHPRLLDFGLTVAVLRTGVIILNFNRHHANRCALHIQ